LSTAGTLGAATTTDDVLSGTDLRGTRVLVTGASAASASKRHARWPRTVRR